jgi:hypothetical protein
VGPTNISRELLEVPPTWTVQEAWAWAQIVEGKVAYLGLGRRHCGGPRLLRPQFLLDVLTRFAGGVPHHGVRILGAQFEDEVDLSAITFDRPLWLAATHFRGDLRLNGARLEGSVSLRRSRIDRRADLSGLHLDGTFDARGAVFRGGLDMSGLKAEGSVWLDGCSLWGNAALVQARIRDQFRAKRATFRGELDMNTLDVGRDIQLDGVCCRGLVRGWNVKVGTVLDMREALFEGDVEMSGLKTGAHLHLGPCSTFRRRVDLGAADVGGTLFANFSVFDGFVEMGGIKVRQSVYLGGQGVGERATRSHSCPTCFRGAHMEERRGSIFTRDPHYPAEDPYPDKPIADLPVADLSLVEARIGGTLQMSGAEFQGVGLRGARIEGMVEAEGTTFERYLDFRELQIDGSFLLREEKDDTIGRIRKPLPNSPPPVKTVVKGEARLEEIKVGNDLDVSGAVFEKDLRLNGARIGGTFDLRGARFSERLALAGATAGGDLQLDTIKRPLPAEVDLFGLRYGRVVLTARDVDSSAERLHRAEAEADAVDGWIKWLERQNPYSPQPYQQLAAVLRAAGHPDRAEAVLYAARDRERAEAWKNGPRLRAAGLWLLKVTIGYGLTGRFPRRVLCWVVALTALGALVLSFSPEAWRRGPVWCLGASFDQLLPIVELNKEFGDFFNDPLKGFPLKRERLAGWQVFYFAIHSLLGFLLGSFAVAALAGLTQSRR